MRSSRIAGYLFLICFLWITLCAFLFTVIRQPIFTVFPNQLIIFSYGMIAPYQEAIAPHGQIYAECLTSKGQWSAVDLAPFYPEMFGERNAREYLTMYSYSGTAADDLALRSQYAQTLQRLVRAKGADCQRVRLAWDKWPAMTGPYDLLHVSTFTNRLPLYGY